MHPMNLDTARLALGRRHLTPMEWAAELKAGWPGPNGSSFSSDSIFGVVIGQTSRNYSMLPADQHDAGYRVLRRLNATTTIAEFELEQLRRRVDDQFFDDLWSMAGGAWTGTRTLYRARCWLRWRAVRRLGGLVNRPDLDSERFLFLWSEDA